MSIAVAVFAGLTVFTSEPAGAWALLCCTWGETPAVATYSNVPTQGSPDAGYYRVFAEEAMRHIEHMLDGRFTFIEAADTPLHKVGINIYADNYGNTEWGGQWSGLAVGDRWYNGSILEYNRYKLDKYIGLTEGEGSHATCAQGRCVDIDAFRWFFLHENSHAIGLDHVSLQEYIGPVPSNCNIMYDNAEPFRKNGACAGQGNFWKADDIQGGLHAYPVPRAEVQEPSNPIEWLLDKFGW